MSCAADDPDVLQSLPVVDATIKTDTPSGPGWHRYNGDGYGDGAGDGHPWAPSNKGTGPSVAGARRRAGEQSIQTGDAAGAAALLDAMARFSSGVGIIPEQAERVRVDRDLARRELRRIAEQRQLVAMLMRHP